MDDGLNVIEVNFSLWLLIGRHLFKLHLGRTGISSSALYLRDTMFWQQIARNGVLICEFNQQCHFLIIFIASSEMQCEGYMNKVEIVRQSVCCWRSLRRNSRRWKREDTTPSGIQRDFPFQLYLLQERAAYRTVIAEHV